MHIDFEGLRRSRDCPRHEWAKPHEETWKLSREIQSTWATRCKHCGMRASRPTLQRLKDEVITQLLRGHTYGEN